MLNSEKETEYIRDNFEKIVKRVIPDANVYLRNFNKAILINRDALDFRTWIRLYYLKDRGFLVDFSSVEFPEEYRRCGILTDLVEFLKNYNNIWKIKFTSVCSEEMLKWCEKNKFTGNEYMDFEWCKH